MNNCISQQQQKKNEKLNLYPLNYNIGWAEIIIWSLAETDLPTHTTRTPSSVCVCGAGVRLCDRQSIFGHGLLALFQLSRLLFLFGFQYEYT